jgi:hypothetical protein
MSGEEKKRYLKVKFHAKSLEGNPLGAPVDRDFAIYLPPKYYEDKSTRYPVIYFLHGYGNQPEKLTVFKDAETQLGGKENAEMLKNVLNLDLEDFPSYQKFDRLILDDEMDPVIFVQPDGCLHLKPIYDLSAFGQVFANMLKGSFYVNSPYTGNYEDYITQDIINYVDSNFRTIPKRSGRAIMGVSMGANGTIGIIARHYDKFIAASAISGAPQLLVSEYDFLIQTKEPRNLVPGFVKFGFPEETIKEVMRKFWMDVIDTIELICSPPENRLVPTVEQKPDGTFSFDREQFLIYKENYKKTLINYVRENPESYKETNLQLRCHAHDPMAPNVESFHDFLELFNVPHEYELYVGEKYDFSPHLWGCLFQIIPGMQFCLKHFQRNK